jgi:hypothetical protein
MGRRQRVYRLGELRLQHCAEFLRVNPSDALSARWANSILKERLSLYEFPVWEACVQPMKLLDLFPVPSPMANRCRRALGRAIARHGLIHRYH